MKFFFVLMLVSFPLFSGIYSELNQNNDHGIWFTERATMKLPYDWKVNFRLEQRLGANYKKFWSYHHEVLFQYTLTKTFSIGPGYDGIYQLQKNTAGIYKWVWINRSRLIANYNFTLFDWSIKNRMIAEYSQYTKSRYKDYGDYRQRLNIYAPWKFTPVKINPFVSNEWFFRNTSYRASNPTGLVGGYYENRFRVGFESGLSDCLGTSLAWQWRAVKQKPGTHPGWFNTFHYCVEVNLNF